MSMAADASAQVERIVTLCAALGRPVATAAQARVAVGVT